ncbi:hypothetical protein FDB40_16105 [Clostridium botulinum]|nr:hypothetical protein [Clostridium botulinum]
MPGITFTFSLLTVLGEDVFIGQKFYIVLLNLLQCNILTAILLFLIGSAIVIIGYLIGVSLNDWNIILKISEFIVVGCFVLSGILNGTFISGDRFRVNYSK